MGYAREIIPAGLWVAAAITTAGYTWQIAFDSKTDPPLKAFGASSTAQKAIDSNVKSGPQIPIISGLVQGIAKRLGIAGSETKSKQAYTSIAGSNLQSAIKRGDKQAIIRAFLVASSNENKVPGIGQGGLAPVAVLRSIWALGLGPAFRTSTGITEKNLLKYHDLTVEQQIIAALQDGQ